jgi:hypothetical protein
MACKVVETKKDSAIRKEEVGPNKEEKGSRVATNQTKILHHNLD